MLSPKWRGCVRIKDRSTALESLTAFNAASLRAATLEATKIKGEGLRSATLEVIPD